MPHHQYTAFSLEVSGEIATVTMRDRAMGPALFGELPLAFSWLENEPSVRAVILRGHGEHFSYGLDLVEMEPLLDLVKPDAGVADRRGFLHALRDLQAAFTSVASIRKPVIAAVDGWCIGGGVDLAAAADVRLATDRAVFSVREAQMAIVADLGSLQRLAGIVGDGHLRELALTGRDVTAQEAMRIGLVNRTYPSAAELDGGALELASQMSRNSPLVLAGVKDVLDAERGARVEAGLRYVGVWNAAFLASEDLFEARQAFRERRRPNFVGR